MRKQLHIVESAASTSGGEGAAALRYAESLAQAGGNVFFASRYLPTAYLNMSNKLDGFSASIAPTGCNFFLRMWRHYRFIQEMCEKEKIELVHLHGTWSPFLAIAALVARLKNLPLIISPHGCLEPWALQYKRPKKWLALNIYQRRIFRWASLFVATAAQEANSIRALKLHQPIAIIPNGIDVRKTVGRNNNQPIKTILFLSRLHPKKGLIDLVNAWAIVRQPGWKVVIAGGDEEGYRAKVEALISEKNIQSDFVFIGFVDKEEKQACFDVADIFILPTYSENFGIVVGEALANEVPVITTTGAPWGGLIESRCGWWVTPGVDGVASALKEAIALEPEELKVMGQRGRNLVLSKYSWAAIGISALAVSNWLLNRSLPKPIEVVEGGK